MLAEGRCPPSEPREGGSEGRGRGGRRALRQAESGGRRDSGLWFPHCVTMDTSAASLVDRGHDTHLGGREHLMHEDYLIGAQ